MLYKGPGGPIFGFLSLSQKSEGTSATLGREGQVRKVWESQGKGSMVGKVAARVRLVKEGWWCRQQFVLFLGWSRAKVCRMQGREGKVF